MVPIKAVLTGLFGVSICLANISGVVTDTGSTPISGAVVKLENAGWTATTGTDGSFKLSASTGILPGNGKLLPNGLSAKISSNVLDMTIAEPATVEVATFDLNGKELSTVRQFLDAGSHSIALPQRGSGIYLYKVKSGNREFVLKGNSVGRAASGSGVSTQGLSSNSLAKQAKVAVAINDVIAATKDGYLNYRCVQYNFDTSGIAIKMLASAGTVTDTDGNVYQTVRIGGQVWMAENLRVTRYNDGSAIPLDTSWSMSTATAPKFCYYSNTTNADSIKKYGALYNWYVVSPSNPKKIAPAGWHVPSSAEWDTLGNYLIAKGYNWDGTTDSNKIAKSLATKTDWATYTSNKPTGTIGIDLTKNNSSGFSGLPGGCRDMMGPFRDQGNYGYWWSTTVYIMNGSLNRYLNFGQVELNGNYYPQSFGFSVRLLRDN